MRAYENFQEVTTVSNLVRFSVIRTPKALLKNDASNGFRGGSVVSKKEYRRSVDAPLLIFSH